MKLKFLKADENIKKAKATIHSSGKLGFSTDAIQVFKLSERQSIAFAQNEEDSDTDLYAVIYEEPTEGAYKVNKAGQYFFVNTKAMFDNLNFDYRNNKIIFDMIKIKYEDSEIIKMVKREMKKKKRETPT